MKFHGNDQKKGTLKIQKSQIAVLVLNQSPISAVFPLVRFAGDQKTALSGDLLYINPILLLSKDKNSGAVILSKGSTKEEGNKRKMRSIPYCYWVKA